MMLSMTRTTVTLDPDVEQLLRDAMQKRRQSFKEALNQAIRSGLAGEKSARERRFKARARPMGLSTGLDPARLNQLSDALEAEAFLSLSRKLESGQAARAPKRK